MVVYLIVVHLALVFLLVERMMGRSLDQGRANQQSAMSHYTMMLVFHRWMDASVPDHAVIFLGDSITQGLATSAAAADSVNYGIGGETTSELLAALPLYQSVNRARLIVLAIGINDLVHGSRARVEERYAKIVVALPKSTPLIWSAVMPVRIEPWMGIQLSDIDDVNRTIRSLCRQRSNCKYVDTTALFTDANGRINASMFLADGIHLSPSGYKKWIEALKSAVKEREN